MYRRLFPVLTSVAFGAALLVPQAGFAAQGVNAAASPSILECIDRGGHLKGDTIDDTKVIGCALDKRLKNVVFFDHQNGVILYPVPAQLEVEDGDVFTIVFLHTDPTSFDYTLKGFSGPDDKDFSLSQRDVSSPGDKRVVSFITWRHDRHFPLYQVKLTLRQKETTAPDAVIKRLQEQFRIQNDALGIPQPTAPAPAPNPPPPPATAALFEYTFPIWVRTTGWNITFNSGFAFSSLRNKNYYVATDKDGNKTVEVDRGSSDQSRPDIVALANLTLPRLKNPSLWWIGEKLGLAFGIGLGGDSDARYYFGPSYVIGKRFILNGGWTAGKVSTLPIGQKLHQAPITDDKSLGTLGSRFAHGWYFGISFTFTPDKETEFLGALTPAQKTGPGTADTKTTN